MIAGFPSYMHRNRRCLNINFTQIHYSCSDITFRVIVIFLIYYFGKKICKKTKILSLIRSSKNSWLIQQLFNYTQKKGRVYLCQPLTFFKQKLIKSPQYLVKRVRLNILLFFDKFFSQCTIIEQTCVNSRKSYRDKEMAIKRLAIVPSFFQVNSYY